MATAKKAGKSKPAKPAAKKSVPNKATKKATKKSVKSTTTRSAASKPAKKKPAARTNAANKPPARPAKKAAAGKPAAKPASGKSPSRKSAAGKADTKPVKKPVAKKATAAGAKVPGKLKPARKASAPTMRDKPVFATKPATTKPAGGDRRKKPITPEQAAEQMRALLAAKQARVRQGPTWPGARSPTGTHGSNAGDADSAFHENPSPPVAPDSNLGIAGMHGRGNQGKRGQS